MNADAVRTEADVNEDGMKDRGPWDGKASAGQGQSLGGRRLGLIWSESFGAKMAKRAMTNQAGKLAG